MMPSYHSGIDEEETFLSFAALPLPEAAVIIDVRQRDVYDVPLLGYLAIEVEDLTRDMRLHQVPRWRHLAECIDFLQLDVRSLFAGLYENSDFLLTTRTGKQIPVQARAELMAVLGRDYLDRVRNHHIRAIKDSAADLGTFDVSGIDPEQPTVRVFFLVDMEQPDSVSRAGLYAHWLKAWIEEQHGPQRFTRDLRIHTVLVCLNVGATFPRELLSSAVTQGGERGLDTIILLQKYRDDAAYIGGDGQFYHTELLLYTMLLHWPRLFNGIIDDPREARSVQLPEEGYTLPCPTYTLGISALESSARWATRWIDYGVTARLLTILSDPHSIDANEEQQISTNIHKWMQNWWQELQEIVPQDMLATVDELQVYTSIQRAGTGRSFVDSTAKDSEEALDTWTNMLAQYYTGTGTSTLQYAMNRSAAGILQQFQWEYIRTSRREDDQDVSGQTYSRLARLYGRIKQLLLLHFQDAQAKAALPRALQQLAVVTKEAQALKTIEQNPPDLEKLRQHFLAQAEEERAQLQRQMRTWQLPVVGTVLRSTVLSTLLVILLGVLIVLGIDWPSIVARMTAPEAFLHAFAQQAFLVLVSIYTLLIVLLIGSEAAYLSWRNKQLAEKRAHIRDRLAKTMRGHLAEVNRFIAAQVALALLQWADLATTRNDSSPYKQRLTQLNEQLLEAQQKAAQQQLWVHQRMKQFPGKPVMGMDMSDEAYWPDLNSRTELLNWGNVEDAFLQTCEELTTRSVALNMLAEMLLRRLGTEKPADILQDILNKQLQAMQAVHEEQIQLSVEEHFHIVHLMVVTLLLSSDTVHLAVTDVLPVLQQYSTLKERVLLPATTIGVDITKIQRTLKEATLASIMQQHNSVAVMLKQEAPPEDVLVAWVGSQHEANALLARTLSSSNAITCLEERTRTIPQALDALQKQCTLLGYPDELDGEDYVYLLLGPGEGSNMFLRSYDPKAIAPVRPALFPDREKLVYLHIHRIRQLSTGLSLTTKHAS